MSTEPQSPPTALDPPLIRNDMPPKDLTDDEILLQNGYTNLFSFMASFSLNCSKEVDVKLARDLISGMRAAAQEKWDEKAWNQMVGAWHEMKRAWAESKEECERVKQAWLQSRLEWKRWDKDQLERDARLRNARNDQ